MSTGTGIEWTQATWNPVSGCTRVSAGCDNCYAVSMTHRLEKMGQTEKYGGLTVLNKAGDRHFNGVVRCDEKALEIPLGWRKPRRIFVNSMSDLFHREVPFEFIDRVFAVMALCPQHTFQVLTKRPERMAEYLSPGQYRDVKVHDAMTRLCSTLDDGTVPAKMDPLNGRRFIVSRNAWATAPAFPPGMDWPLPNVWLGTSCEDEAAAFQRIPHLLRCSAAVRFLSLEPLLGHIRLRTGVYGMPGGGEAGTSLDGIGWVIVGGESGKGARPCNVEWLRWIVAQCQAVGVPVFVKQLGACSLMSEVELEQRTGPWETITPRPGAFVKMRLEDPKGGDITEWPSDLRVREFPGATP